MTNIKSTKGAHSRTAQGPNLQKLFKLSRRPQNELPQYPFKEMRKLKRRKSGVPHSLFNWFVSNGTCQEHTNCQIDENNVQHFVLGEYKFLGNNELELIGDVELFKGPNSIVAVWFKGEKAAYFQGLYRVANTRHLKLVSNQYNLNNGAVIGFVRDL